jgi:hypothetical protein
MALVGLAVTVMLQQQMRSARCEPESCKVSSKPSLSKRAPSMFAAEFETCDGSKNRCLGQRKMWIRQVLISRTLTDCGEVAERLKAAVC